MSTSGSRNWITTRNTIIYAALRKLGVLATGDTPRPEAILEASFTLNSLVNSWQNDGVLLWTMSDTYQALTSGTSSYSLDTATIGVENLSTRRDGSETTVYEMTKDEYGDIANKGEEGTPISAYVDYQLAAPVLYVWPTPTYSTSIVVGTDANHYLCILDHTSDADNRPITGADYSTYWEQVASGGVAWGTGTSYHSDILLYSKVVRLQDFDTAPDNPDFPVQWNQALIWGLADELSFDYGIPDAEKSKISKKAALEYIRARRTQYDATDLKFYV